MSFFQRTSCKLLQNHRSFRKISSVADTSLFRYQFISVFICEIQSKGVIAVHIPIGPGKLHKGVVVHGSHFFTPGICQWLFTHTDLNGLHSWNLQKDLHYTCPHQKFPGT